VARAEDRLGDTCWSAWPGRERAEATKLAVPEAGPGKARRGSLVPVGTARRLEGQQLVTTLREKRDAAALDKASRLRRGVLPE
jgi:hypothetical protein